MRLVFLLSTVALLGASKPPLSTLDGVEPRLPGAKANNVDTMTTGDTFAVRQFKAWKKMRDEYRRCPSCVDQPFPGDEREMAIKKKSR